MATAFNAGDRVQVTNQSLDSCGMFGTVKLTDTHGSVWVRLDGFSQRQCISFDFDDLSGDKDPSPLAYPDEPTTNPYV